MIALKISCYSTLTRYDALTISRGFENHFYIITNQVHNAEVAALESAHYIYPVNMQTVLRNEDMKNVICRNF